MPKFTHFCFFFEEEEPAQFTEKFSGWASNSTVEKNVATKSTANAETTNVKKYSYKELLTRPEGINLAMMEVLL